MRHALLGVVALALCGHASAFYASPTFPERWGGSPGSWTFNPPGGWSGGAAGGSVSQSIGGRAVNIPFSARMAGNAGAAVASAIRITPAGIITAAVASWLLTEGISWVNDQWETANGPVLNGPTYKLSGSGACSQPYTCGPDLSTLISAYKTQLCNGFTGCVITETWKGYGPPSSSTQGSTSESSGFNYSRVRNGYGTDTGNVRWGVTCPGGGNYIVWISWSTPYTCTGQSQESAPATQTDWDKFANKPVPDQVANDVGTAIPVEQPTLNPDAQGQPQPQRVPVGNPQPVVGTSPQEYRQPVVDLVPSPVVDDPFRVDVQPKEIIGTDPVGQTEPAPVPSENPPPAVTPEQIQLCEAYPDIAACQPLGSVDDMPTIETKVIDLDITPYSGFGPSTSSCPAPRSVQLLGGGGMSLQMPFDLLCDFANGVRPVIIGLAWLAAVMAWLGLSRKD